MSGEYVRESGECVEGECVSVIPGKYRIAGKFDGELNLMFFWSWLKLPN